MEVKTKQNGKIDSGADRDNRKLRQYKVETIENVTHQILAVLLNFDFQFH